MATSYSLVYFVSWDSALHWFNYVDASASPRKVDENFARIGTPLEKRVGIVVLAEAATFESGTTSLETVLAALKAADQGSALGLR